MGFSNLTTVTFIDNWAWIAGTRLAFALALSVVQNFCRQLLLPINWAKSFAWAVKADDRRWIDRVVPDLLPDGVNLALVTSAKDLGVAFTQLVL